MAFRSQTDGQLEKTIQFLKDMLRAYILNYVGGWHQHIQMVEFAYNNSYKASIRISPFEALYGRKCQSHLHWSEVGEKTTLGPDVLVKAEKKVGIARQHLVTAQSRQKLYSDKRNMTLSSKLENRYS